MSSTKLCYVSIGEIVKIKINLKDPLCPFCHRKFDHFKERNNHVYYYYLIPKNIWFCRVLITLHGTSFSHW